MPSRGSCCASPFSRCSCPPGPRGPAGPAGPSAEAFLSGVSQDQIFNVTAGGLAPIIVPILLEPSSTSFTSSGNILEYTGNTAKTFTLHGQVIVQWLNSDGAPGGTSATFILGLLLDGVPILTGAWVEVLIRFSGLGDGPQTFHTQRLVRLNPNSIVQLGINSTALGGRPVGEQETMRLYGLSLIVAAA